MRKSKFFITYERTSDLVGNDCSFKKHVYNRFLSGHPIITSDTLHIIVI